MIQYVFFLNNLLPSLIITAEQIRPEPERRAPHSFLTAHRCVVALLALCFYHTKFFSSACFFFSLIVFNPRIPE